jgi:LPXTG-motif cell wall-anchored protein
MEITGKFEHADDAKIAAGEKSSRLPAEIVVASFRQAPSAAGEAPPSPAASTTAPPPSSTTAPAPSSTVARTETAPLPKTASNEPLIALIGLLSLGVGIGLNVFRRRAS